MRKIIKRGIIPLAILLFLIISLNIGFASDETIEIILDSLGTLESTDSLEVIDNNSNKVIKITGGGKYHLTQNNPESTVTTNIIVDSEEDVELILDNINITAGTYERTSVFSSVSVGTAAISIEGNTNCLITLKDDSTNTITGASISNNSLYNVSAIAVENTISNEATHLSTLTIAGESGDDSTGTLKATGGLQSAAIGGNCNRLTGNIIINSGNIYATSGDYGAAIGDGDTIDINDSLKDNKIWTVGETNSTATININGGYVYATATKDTPGIGTADNLKSKYNATTDVWTGMKILINGGEIITIGGNEAYSPSAGIGAGSGTYLASENIVINKGTKVLSVTRTNEGSYALTNSGGQTVPEINSISSANVLNLKLTNSYKAKNINFWQLVDGVYEQISDNDFPNSLLNDMGETSVLGLAVVLPDGTYRITDNSGNIIGDNIQLYNGGITNGEITDSGKVEIRYPISISNPESVSVNPGDEVTFTVDSLEHYSNDELTYEWYKSTDDGATWGKITTTTTNTLTITNVELSDNNTKYRVTATKKFDSEIITATSEFATLTVTNNYDIILSENKDDSSWIKSGNSYTIYQNEELITTLDYIDNSNSYTANIEAGEYDVYLNGKNINHKITITKNSKTFDVDFYTINLTVTSTNSNDYVTLNDNTYHNQSVPYEIVYLKDTNISLTTTLDTEREIEKFSVNAFKQDQTAIETDGYNISSLDEKTDIIVLFGDKKYPTKPEITLDESISESELPEITLVSDDKTYTLTDEIPNGEYKIYLDGEDSGQVAGVSKGEVDLTFYKIILTKDDGISSVTGEGVYLEGTSATITSELNSGYNFSGWYDSTETLIYASLNKTISKIDKSYTLVAKSEKIKANEAQVTGSGSTTTYNDGTTPIINVTATSSDDEIISYQWFKTDEKGNSKEIISGATEATYETSDTDSGTYYYYCEVTTTRSDNQETATTGLTIETVINKAVPIMTAEDEEKDYTGEIISITEPTFSNVDTVLSVTYTYCLDENCNTLTNLDNSGSNIIGGSPVKPGVYYVKITSNESQNYTSVTKTVKLTIIDNNSVKIENPQTNDKKVIILCVIFTILSFVMLVNLFLYKSRIKKYYNI